MTPPSHRAPECGCAAGPGRQSDEEVPPRQGRHDRHFADGGGGGGRGGGCAGEGVGEGAVVVLGCRGDVAQRVGLVVEGLRKA